MYISDSVEALYLTNNSISNSHNCSVYLSLSHCTRNHYILIGYELHEDITEAHIYLPTHYLPNISRYFLFLYFLQGFMEFKDFLYVQVSITLHYFIFGLGFIQIFLHNILLVSGIWYLFM